jgi:hypothetical protein
MSTASPRPAFAEPRQFVYRFPVPIEISLTALVLALSAAVSVQMFFHAATRPDSVVFRVASVAWLTLVLLFPWLLVVRVLQDRTSKFAGGEIVGVIFEIFVMVFLALDWLTPEGPFKLLWAYFWYPVLVIMFLISCWLLCRTVLGRRRQIRHRLVDAVGLVLVVGFEVWLTVGLRLAPPAW